ncbi:MAG: carbohydrate kinase family protein [Streptosporangiales bacterium]|nr:carbohydrate kinase family protein [Streptosporangiales bacterium]
MAKKIVVAGVTSLYVAVGVGGFPLRYRPTSRPAWLASGVTGAGGHIAKVLRRLGDDVRLCTVVGRDPAGAAIRADLDAAGLLGPAVVEGPASTMGLVLVTPEGRRMGYPHLRPLDRATYPRGLFRRQARGADLLVLTNTRFVRDLLPEVRDLGVPIAVDVHLVSDLEDPYNLPWLEAATVVFCSHEKLPCPPAAWVARVFQRYPRCRLVGVGRGTRGLLLGVRDGRLIRVNAIAPRGVINTSGAGDALFAAFLHGWLATGDPVSAAEDAVLIAGWKIGDVFPGSGSLSDHELSALRATHGVRSSLTRWKEPPHPAGEGPSCRTAPDELSA